jgi:hypothetical protein
VIIHTWHCDTGSPAPEPELAVPRDLVDAFSDDDFDDDAAEICRMIELSGMIGLECGLLEGE